MCENEKKKLLRREDSKRKELRKQIIAFDIPFKLLKINVDREAKPEEFYKREIRVDKLLT